MEYSIPKGVFDILPNDPDQENSWKNSDRWQHLESVIRTTCAEYGYKEIRTPIFEKTELFVRGVGEGSDIVSKEMYTFEDKGGRSMTLRPEGTASVMRSFVENQLYQQSSVHKFFYVGPMFRYERPQAGRYRQHHQFGAEAIGIAKPEQDVELIDLICELYRRLGLKNLQVQLNSVGDAASRQTFMESLRSHILPHLDSLSEDSKIRFTKNILRILDSKSPEDQPVIRSAPSILDYLNEECTEHFNRVCYLLKKSGIHYEINTRLVRGLDYYNKTVFEITSGELGAQNSIGAGGRYDGLTAELGGPSLPSVGFATGIERVLQTMAKQNCFFPEPPHPFLFLLPLGAACLEYCFELALLLRHEGIATEVDLSAKKIQQGLQYANYLKADYCLVIGEQELDSKQAVLKNMTTRQQQPIDLNRCVETIKEMRKSHV
jgi:histidyl-tRNA synthetase